MADEEGTQTSNSDIPSWVQVSLFEPVFREIYPDYRQTKDFKAEKALSPGENYATIMLRLEADIELTDGSSKVVSLMLKTSHDSEVFREFMKINNVFKNEADMYDEVVPHFEQLYKDAGIDVKFAAKTYKLDTLEPYMLLEDLKPKGFINVNRLEGLDMEHTHCVLTKLAQWHAASAVYVATKGPFKTNLAIGFFNEETREKMKGIMTSWSKIIMDCIKTFEGHELYYDNLVTSQENRIDALHDSAKPDKSEFNVLNHGDCWANNVMFKHDAFGKVKETYLVDYQIPHYGSPAQDLYYFLLSSTKYELKIQHFDYFIKYYHNQLVEHLNILNYNRTLPTLKDIHIMLHKHNSWAVSTVTGVLAAVLLDRQDDANLDNFMSDTDAGIKLKIQMYSNARYRKHCQMLFPWLLNRGAI